MTSRPSPWSIACALAFALAVVLPAHAQTAIDTSSNAAPAAPADTNAAPAAPADTNAAPATDSTGRPTTYTVVKGDAVATIAHKFGITWTELRKANHLKKNAILQPGQVLQIPPATSGKTAK